MVLPSRQQSAIWGIISCTYSIRWLPHVRQNGLFLFIALMRMVTFMMKVVHNLSVWALRARSYKTRAEDWAAGHRPPSSSRGLSWFLSCFQKGVQVVQKVQKVQEVQKVQKVQGVQGVQEVQEVQEVRGIILTTVFHISSLLSSSSQYHIPMSRTRTRNIYIR